MFKFQVRVCGQDGERASAERAEDRARSEWNWGGGGRGWMGVLMGWGRLNAEPRDRGAGLGVC